MPSKTLTSTVHSLDLNRLQIPIRCFGFGNLQQIPTYHEAADTKQSKRNRTTGGGGTNDGREC